MRKLQQHRLDDTGERIIPTERGEVSYVFSRHKFAYEYARQYAQTKRVLDVGCGTGYGCKILSDVAQSVVGIDYNEEAIAFCQAHFSTFNITFTQIDAADLPFRKEFDLAVSFQVIEHMPNLHLFLKSLTGAVRTGGTILLTTPNVREPVPEDEANPFHANEMNFDQFYALLSQHFPSFTLIGIGYAASNKLRTFLQRSPLYRLGKYIHRKSPVKKLANSALHLTEFRVLNTDIARDAIDLLAICKNE